MTVRVIRLARCTPGFRTAGPIAAWPFLVSFAPTTALANGVHALHVRAQDLAGNYGPPSKALVVTIAAAAPAEAITLKSVAEPPLMVTHYGLDAIDGTAAPGAAITLTWMGDHVLGTTTTDADGNWSIPGAYSGEILRQMQVTASGADGQALHTAPLWLQVGSTDADTLWEREPVFLTNWQPGVPPPSEEPNILVGGPGDDVYVVHHSSAQVVEYADEGTDTIYATCDYTLAPGASIEFLRPVARPGLVMTGNEQDNTLVSGTDANTLTGGLGADVFRFEYSTSAITTITDFSHDQGDVLDLSAFGLSAADYIGDAPFSNLAGQIRATVSGNDTMVEVDTNADGGADLTIRLGGAPVLVASDFRV